MEKSDAEVLSMSIRMASAIGNDALGLMKNRRSEKEVEEFALLYGRFSGLAYLDILKPLWSQYPELLPTEMGGKAPGGLIAEPGSSTIDSFIDAARSALLLMRDLSQASAPELNPRVINDIAQSITNLETFRHSLG
jgi:hypothetical protein